MLQVANQTFCVGRSWDARLRESFRRKSPSATQQNLKPAVFAPRKKIQLSVVSDVQHARRPFKLFGEVAEDVAGRFDELHQNSF